MPNWIVLYHDQYAPHHTVKEDANPYTKVLPHVNESAAALAGLGALFNNNQYVGLAIPLSVLMAIPRVGR